jgi:hypothetical protein
MATVWRHKYIKLLKKLRKECVLRSDLEAVRYILQYWSAFDPEFVALAEQDLQFSQTKTKSNQILKFKS